MTSTTDVVFHGIFTTALEGGINYWAYCSAYHWHNGGRLDDEGYEGYKDYEDYEGFYAIIEDSEDMPDDPDDYECKPIRIDRSVISKGYRLASGAEGDSICWSTRKPPVVPSEDWDYDACDADCIVQLGLFGDVRYG